MRRRDFLAFAGALPLLGAASEAPGSLRFELNAVYFSRQMQIDPALDPQVFVPDPTVAVGGIGLQGITHVAGLRALRLDDPDTQLFTADDVGMGFTSTRWLAARGSGAVATLSDGSSRVTLAFERLVVFGAYSLLKRVSGASGDVYVPLDGTGRKSAFIADAAGGARIALQSPQPLDPTSAILLVYHSDGKPQGLRAGALGLTTHDHLIAPLERKTNQPA